MASMMALSLVNPITLKVSLRKLQIFSERSLIRLSPISTTVCLLVVEIWGNLIFNGFCNKSLVVGSVLSDKFLSSENLFDVGISESSGLDIYCLWFLNIVYNDFPILINKISVVIMFADDTGILITANSQDELLQRSNHVLNHMSKWFRANLLT